MRSSSVVTEGLSPIVRLCSVESWRRARRMSLAVSVAALPVVAASRVSGEPRVAPVAGGTAANSPLASTVPRIGLVRSPSSNGTRKVASARLAEQLRGHADAMSALGRLFALETAGVGGLAETHIRGGEHLPAGGGARQRGERVAVLGPGAHAQRLESLRLGNEGEGHVAVRR